NAGNYVSGSSEEDYSQETIPPRVSVGTEPNMDLNQSVLISFCKQIATAMAYIAEKKVVHRDLIDVHAMELDGARVFALHGIFH
ncbi:unnamed protein product, partial [Allacma fusca]